MSKIKGKERKGAKDTEKDAHSISVALPDGLKSLGKLYQKQTEETPIAAGTVCQVHRCKFLDYTPHAILALTFNAAGDRLAVARDSGDIEIWDVKHGWFCERVRCACVVVFKFKLIFVFACVRADNSGFGRSHCAVFALGAWA